ncbi:Brix domain-containing protein [Mycena olivaceomarginata]|nr:Brix domain-containing protein [Mycena olivaceomarginata]
MDYRALKKPRAALVCFVVAFVAVACLGRSVYYGLWASPGWDYEIAPRPTGPSLLFPASLYPPADDDSWHAHNAVDDAQKANATSKGDSKGKRKANEMEVDEGRACAAALVPWNHPPNEALHERPGSITAPCQKKSQLHLLPELADLNNCNNTLYFEARRHEDLYLWASKTPNGPSIKMHVQNVHTMDELNMTGNCLKGSRGLLSFDKAFDDTEWGKLTKEIFNVPSTARKAKPFIDHILTFSILDNKIWFRNFQVRIPIGSV